MGRVVIVIAALLICSCAHTISKDIREGARLDVSFKSVKKDIGKYTGSTFIWGGFIVGTKRTEEGTEIQIVQNPVDSQGHIIDLDISYGRFIALHEGELDPLIYQRDRLITVAGELVGGREATLGKKPYTYPLLRISEIYLWKDELLMHPPDYGYWGPPYRRIGPWRRPLFGPYPPYHHP
jgi:outer membrane lipoprotein